MMMRAPAGTEHAVAGAFAGVVGTVLGSPLDTIKTRLQAEAKAGGSSRMLPVARSIYRQEGVRGFYRGLAPPLAALTILNTLSFSSYSAAKRVLGVEKGKLGLVTDYDGRNSFVFEPRVMLAGMAGGPLGSLLSTPMELVKVQMQLDSSRGRRFRSSWHAAQCIVREGGLRALYSGHVTNTVREATFLAAYFGTYEHSRTVIEHNVPAAVAIPVAGGVSGALAWLISFPLDCIKANIQGQRIEAAAAAPRRVTAASAAQAIFRAKGVLGLYSGVGPSIARAFLVSGSRFSAYETMVWLIRAEGDAAAS